MLPMIDVLAVPIVPFLLFGAQVEAALAAWRSNPPPPLVVAAVVIALLSTDILLPIPSSLVCTLAGWELGSVVGAAAASTGLSLGAVLGFALARRFGPSLVTWL